MTFRVLHQPSTNQTRCPYRVIVQTHPAMLGKLPEVTVSAILLLVKFVD